MKCPKCQYVGFDTGDRCRNCGYEFALLLEAPGPAEGRSAIERLDLILRSPVADEPPSALAPALPLFHDDEDMDAPLVRTAPPRQPVAVRKTPEPQRIHLSRTVTVDPPVTPRLEFGADSGGQRLRPESSEPLPHRRGAEPLPAAPRVPAVVEAPIVGSLGARVVAAVIDYALLLGIDLIVLHFTLRLTALTFADWRMIPLAPLLVFLIGVKLAYLTAFTLAGGQTIGKMATGLRVVPDDTRRMAIWDAAQRALVEVASMAACGLPFLLALKDPERRGLHDRVAHTRVVPVS